MESPSRKGYGIPILYSKGVCPQRIERICYPPLTPNSGRERCFTDFGISNTQPATYVTNYVLIMLLIYVRQLVTAKSQLTEFTN